MCNSQVYVTHMWMQLIRNTKKRENKLKIELQRMKKKSNKFGRLQNNAHEKKPLQNLKMQQHRKVISWSIIFHFQCVCNSSRPQCKTQREWAMYVLVMVNLMQRACWGCGHKKRILSKNTSHRDREIWMKWKSERREKIAATHASWPIYFRAAAIAENFLIFHLAHTRCKRSGLESKTQ